jgi:hypothetical protein
MAYNEQMIMIRVKARWIKGNYCEVQAVQAPIRSAPLGDHPQR